MKVPIEVILQDPTQPMPPTPDPTPITPVVPNTGAETMQTVADVTNGVSVGLVIIASLIFAVAIGALMLYLFHLYNHQKAVIEQHEEKNKEKHNKTNDAAEDQNPFGSNKEQKAESVLTTIKEHNTKKAKAHKWSKGLFIASGATAVLAFAAFIGSFIFYSMIQPNSSSATSLGDTDSTYVTNNGTITITANLYNNEPVITGIKDTALVTTDATKGYELYLSMSDNSLDNKLYLDGDTTSEYYITPTSGQLNTEQNSTTPLELNTWGINLDGSDNYAALPTIANKLLIKTANTAVTEDPVDIYYSVKVDKSLPYGTYKGEIEYNVEPIIAKDLSSISTMQEMTAEIRDNTPTPPAFKEDGVTINDDVPTATLTDTRDGKTYTVAKLADGKVWMIQNMDLQKEKPDGGTVATLTSADTDLPEGVTFELPDSQTSGGESWGNEERRVYDFQETTGSDGKTYVQKELGNLYNWYTATAGTGTINVGSGGNLEDARGSLCPKGWRLPKDNIAKDYEDLLNGYNMPTSAAGNIALDIIEKFKIDPFSFVQAGAYHGKTEEYLNEQGNYWSSSGVIKYGGSYIAASTFRMGDYGGPQVYINDEQRNVGISVRCIAE